MAEQIKHWMTSKATAEPPSVAIPTPSTNVSINEEVMGAIMCLLMINYLSNTD
jgi:hypothetical protein